jgi:radical SAM superfamily enzyme YgiQ (UPF0313 family)
MSKNKNILLVYPKIPETYWSFSYALPFIGKKASMPPLGIITVAAMIPNDYNLRLVDMNIEPLKDADFEWADVVFTSSMIVQKKSLEEVIKKANSLDIPVVAGGPYPTQHFDQIKGVDHFILGEAESGVLEAFFNDFKNNRAKKAYVRQVIRKREGGREIDQQFLDSILRHFEKQDVDIQVAEERPSMSLSPIPRFDLLDMNAYISMALQESRGCPHDCEFCNEGALFGHQPRLKESDKMIEELEALHKLGFRGSIFYVDDNFIGNRKKIKEILPKVIEFQKKHNYPFTFYTEADISLALDEELMALMRDAGFNMAFIGLESPDEEVLRAMGKNQNVKINLSESVRKIQSYGIEVTAGFIVGNDNDPPDICDKIFDFCQKEGIVTAMVGLLNAMKGSRLYERLKREGRIRRDSTGNNTHNFELNFDHLPGKDEEKIISDYKNLLARLYDSSGDNCFRRINILMDRLGSHPKPAGTVRYAEIRALGISLAWQSFSSYGSNYRKLIGHTLRHHRKIGPKAVHQAICAYHFIKMTKYALKADKIKGDFIEKARDYQSQISEALETRLAEGRKKIAQIQCDVNEFLRKTRRKIRKLPGEYRDVLTEVYKKIANKIHIQLERSPVYIR